jgi:hypothetical protein
MSQAVLESLRDSRKIFLDVTISAFLKAMFDEEFRSQNSGAEPELLRLRSECNQ